MENLITNQLEENIVEGNIIKDIRNHFTLEKKQDSVKDRVLRDIRTLFEPEENYYRLAEIVNVCHNNYIEYESNGDKNKTLSVKEFLDIIRPYLRKIINDYEKQGEWKTQLTIAINLFSF